MEQIGMRNVVEKTFDVGVNDFRESGFVALADAGDGAVNTAAGTVAEAAFQELFLEGVREVAGGGGLQDAVADGGDHQGAHFTRARVLFDDDAEEGHGAVEALVGEFQEFGELGVGFVGEGFDGDAVHSGAAVVFLDAFPGGPKLF